MSAFDDLLSLVTELGQKEFFRRIFQIHLLVPLIYIVPFFILTLLNILTIRKLLQYRNRHRKLFHRSNNLTISVKQTELYPKQNQQATNMLVSVVILFLLCNYPMLINGIYEVHYSMSNGKALTDNLLIRCRIQRSFSTFAKFLQTLNSIGNFFIYLYFYPNFRQIIRQMISHVCGFLQ